MKYYNKITGLVCVTTTTCNCNLNLKPMQSIAFMDESVRASKNHKVCAYVWNVSGNCKSPSTTTTTGNHDDGDLVVYFAATTHTNTYTQKPLRWINESASPGSSKQQLDCVNWNCHNATVDWRARISGILMNRATHKASTQARQSWHQKRAHPSPRVCMRCVYTTVIISSRRRRHRRRLLPHQ